MNAGEFAAKVRAGEDVVGYWVLADSPVTTERIAGAGYDYVVIDMQHGLIGYSGMLAGLTAIDAAGAAVGLVRVADSTATAIGRALDAGASGVIVAMIDDAEQAAAAVAAARYPPRGVRSFGPMRSGLRIGPDPADADAVVVVLAMIETANGLADVERIAATPGLDGLYIGPADLRLAVGGRTPSDPAADAAFDDAVQRILGAARDNGIACGIYTTSGDAAARRRDEGFSVLTIANDVDHLTTAARAHLDVYRGEAAAEQRGLY